MCFVEIYVNLLHIFTSPHPKKKRKEKEKNDEINIPPPPSRTVDRLQNYLKFSSK